MFLQRPDTYKPFILSTFTAYRIFTGEGDKISNKVIKGYINVSVVIDIECGDTFDKSNFS